MAKSDGKGLIITLPTKRTDRGAVGVEPRFGVRGDFVITLAYEILGVEDPPLSGAGVSLMLKFVSGPASGVAITHLKKPGGDTYGANMITVGSDGKDQYKTSVSPAAQSRGSVRLVREAGILKFLVAEQTTFREIKTMDWGSGDVSLVRAACTTGGSPGGVTVRLIDLNLQADSFPDDSPARGVEPPLRRTLVVWWVIGGALIGGALVGTVVWWRRRRRPNHPPETDAMGSTANPRRVKS